MDTRIQPGFPLERLTEPENFLSLLHYFGLLSIRDVVEQLLAEGAIPAGSEEDALHIAIAAAQGADYLLTWNFRHINNAERKSAIAGVVESFGFVRPQICSPEELEGDSDD